MMLTSSKILDSDNQQDLFSAENNPNQRIILSNKDERLLEQSIRISSEKPSGEDMAFMHAVLCQVGFPRSKFDGRDFLRRSGDAWVNIQAGVLDEGDGPVYQPIPYGALPRLAMAWITTFAIRNKTREVPVGDSAAEFLRKLGQNRATGGVRGSLTMLHRQIHALAACRLQLGFKGRTYNGQPIEQFETWLPSRGARGHVQRAMWKGVITLSSPFFDEILEHGVPLDNRAILMLKGSAMALDEYFWLAHRLHRIEGKRVFLPWHVVRDQFGQECKGKNSAKDFRTMFVHALDKVKVVYPNALVDVVNCGLSLRRSPPPIPYKS